MGLNFNMQLIMSGVVNCVQLVGVISSLWTLDRFGRRKILLTGSICMFIPHLIISIFVGKYSHDWPSYIPEGWTSVAFLLAYMLAFGCSWGPVPWAMPSEVFPSSLRAKGVALATSLSKYQLLQPLYLPGLGLTVRRLVMEFHYRPHHPTPYPRDWLRGLRLFRSLLPVVFCVDLLLCPRDERQDP